MTGLLIKDFKLLRQQGRSYLLIIALVIVLCLAGTVNYSSFMTSYMTFLVSMFTISTFTYDEADGGLAFLMSLPVQRRTYVLEKYLFGICLTVGAWIVSGMIHLGFLLTEHAQINLLEMLGEDSIYLIIVLFFIEYSVPLIVKFGAEKGRNISMGILGIFAMMVFVWARSGANLDILRSISEASEKMPYMVLAVLWTVSIMIFCISAFVSIKFMEKREF